MANPIVIPRLGWSMDEGTFVGWLKNEGDYVRRGEPLFELEGDKAVQAIESVDEGILHIPPDGPAPGRTLSVGSIIGFLVAEGEPAPDSVSPSTSAMKRFPESAIGPPLSKASQPHVSCTGPTIESHIADDRSPAIATPRARRVASELGIDWTRLTGSGAGGRVRERDIRAAAATRNDVGSGATVDRRVPVTHRRRVIAQHMIASHEQTVPVTLTTRADASRLVELREHYKSTVGASNAPSYQDIVTKLAAETLKEHRLLAGRRDGDAIVVPDDDGMHLGIAVETDDGLVVPVLRNVSAMTLVELASKSRQLIEHARAGTLTPADMQDGVFTITNLGAYGIDAFTPVINTPETAILGLGTIRREPAVLGEQIVARWQLTLSLTFDHRLIDGAPAARFLRDVAERLASICP